MLVLVRGDPAFTKTEVIGLDILAPRHPNLYALIKSYSKRLKDDVTSMISNFTEIINLCKIEEPNQISRPAQCEEDAFEMQVRAANMVRAGESLMKLISDIKQYLILNDFPSVNEAITYNSKLFLGIQEQCDKRLTM